MSPNRWGTLRIVVGSDLELEVNPAQTCRIYDGPNREPLAELSNRRLLAALLRFARRKPLAERLRTAFWPEAQAMKSLWSSWLRWIGPEPNWIEVARVKLGDRETFRYHDHRCAVGYLRSWLRERKASL